MRRREYWKWNSSNGLKLFNVVQEVKPNSIEQFYTMLNNIEQKNKENL